MKRINKHSDHGCEGFTLVEMILVLGIISLLSTVSIIAFNSMVDAGKMNSGSDMVANEIRLSRETALNSSCETALIFQTQGAHPYARMAVYKLVYSAGAS